jgi:hypothetical protein
MPSLFAPLLKLCLFASAHAAPSVYFTSDVHGVVDVNSPAQLSLPFATIVDVDPIVINASCDAVWTAVTAFEGYGEWNTFVTRANVTSLAVGSAVEMQVNWGAAGKVLTFQPERVDMTEYISGVSVDAAASNYALSYGGENWKDWVLAFERVQSLQSLGAEKCKYKTFDRFGGILNPLVQWLFRGPMHAGFTAMQGDLKRFVEGTPAANNKGARAGGAGAGSAAAAARASIGRRQTEL